MRRVGPTVLTGTVLYALAAGVALGQAAIPCGSEYTVVAGDTVGSIARRAYTGRDFRALYQLNTDRIGPDINSIEIGVRLRIPCDLREALAQQPQAESATDATPVTTATSVVIPSEITASPSASDAALNRVDIAFNSALDPQFVLNAKIISPYLAEIERVTQRRVTFSEPTSVNRLPEEQMALVIGGRADGAYIFNNHLAGSHPLVQLTMNPMTGGTAQQTAVALWRVYQSHLRRAGTFEDVKLLGFIGAPPAQIWQTKPGALPDLGGLLGSTGARPSDLTGAASQPDTNRRSVKSATGTPEAAILQHSTARAFGVTNRYRIVSEIDGGVYAPTVSVFISREKWNQISPRDQRAIEDISGEALARRSVAWDVFENANKIENRRTGVRIVQPDVELLTTLQDRANLGWERWIQAADGRGVSGFRAIDAFFREIGNVKRELPG